MRPQILLARDLVAGLDLQQRMALRALAQSRASEMPAPMRHALLSRLPNVLEADGQQGALRFRLPEMATLFAEALGEDIPDEPGAPILRRLAQGDPDAALAAFQAEGGPYLQLLVGESAAAKIISAFPRALQQGNTTLVLAAAMVALNGGHVSRARHLLAQRFGPDVADLSAVLAAPERFPVELRLFRFVMTLHEDVAITDATRARLIEALGEVSLDDHLQRGSFCHAMLEFHLRRRDMEAAEEYAQRAHRHYAAAGAHLPGFLIDIYRAVLALVRATPAEAARHADAAREQLARVTFEHPSETRLLGLVDAVIGCERGDMEGLVRYLAENFDQFAYGEMWPTLAELTVDYGGSALSRHIALNAARLFLDLWRIQEWRSNRFRLVVTLREVSLLQEANRWQEAAELLTAVQSRVNRTWVEGAVDTLVRLVDPSEIGLAMAWLRHLIREVPQRILLRDQIEELLRNRHVTERQRMKLNIWMAGLSRQQRDVSAARASLLKAFEAGARLGTILPFVEEGGILSELMKDTRLASFIRTSADARAVLARMKRMERPSLGEARRAGLTRQEARVLALAAEGATNKVVARQLGLTEVTVKFHLSNVYRKLGCTGRAEAIATAKALDWVG